MTQDAIVTKLLANSMAEVVVTRTTACGSNCGNCESCIFQNEIKTVARNSIAAKPGQRVIIESKSSKIYRAAFLVYIVPFIFFFVGYSIAYSLGLNEPACVVISLAALALSAAFIVYVERHKKRENRLTVDIIKLAKDVESL